MICLQCGKNANSLAVAMTKKFVGRGVEQYYCIPCLARHFRVPSDVLLEKARYLQKQGCTLFAGMQIPEHIDQEPSPSSPRP